MKSKICVQVPATSANLGPGFDTLGIALALYNRVYLQLGSKGGVKLEGAAASSSGALKMVRETVDGFSRATGIFPHGVKVKIKGDVPLARGLGSSVTVRLGITAGLNRLFGNPLDRQGLLDLVTELEGHPDNAAPALMGGMVVSGVSGGRVVAIQKKLPASLRFVMVIPDFEVVTHQARKLLPKTVSLKDAVHNLNRTAMVVAAFWSGQWESLGDFLDDRLHQPARSRLIPQLFPALNAARLAGALGGWLSGSGSAVLAITQRRPREIGEAMKAVFTASRCRCRILILSADNRGVAFIS